MISVGNSALFIGRIDEIYDRSMMNNPEIVTQIKQKVILELEMKIDWLHDGFELPATPDCSDSSDCDDDANDQPAFGETKKTKISSITQVTQQLELLNGNNINALNNNNNDPKFGIYNQPLIYKQAMRPNKNVHLNGDDLINNAKHSKKRKKKKKSKLKRRKKKF